MRRSYQASASTEGGDGSRHPLTIPEPIFLGFSIIGNSLGDDHEGDAIAPGAVSTARRGIPQGSAASPIVAEAMIAIALKAVPTLGVLIIAYADNILLLAKTKSDRDSMTKALLAAFEAHPVGRLRLSPRTFAPGEPIEFLGHRLTPCEGGVHIEPDDDNKRKFEDRMKSKLRSLAKTKRQTGRRKALHDIKKHIQSWVGAFTLCDDIQKIRSYWLARAHAQFKEGPDFIFDEEETMSNTVYKTFKLHPDQEGLVDCSFRAREEAYRNGHGYRRSRIRVHSVHGNGNPIRRPQ